MCQVNFLLFAKSLFYSLWLLFFQKTPADLERFQQSKAHFTLNGTEFYLHSLQMFTFTGCNSAREIRLSLPEYSKHFAVLLIMGFLCSRSPANVRCFEQYNCTANLLLATDVLHLFVQTIFYAARMFMLRSFFVLKRHS